MEIHPSVLILHKNYLFFLKIYGLITTEEPLFIPSTETFLVFIAKHQLPRRFQLIKKKKVN